MNRQNWYPNQLVNVDNMDAIEATAQGGTNALASYLGKGIIAGLALTPSAPNSLLLGLAVGTIVLEDGTIVTIPAARSIDLTQYVPAAGQPNVVVNLFAIPVQSGDTPVVTPAGATINYRLFDDLTLVAQVQAAGGLVLTGQQYTGSMLGQVTLAAGQTEIDGGSISFTNTVYWLSVAALGVLVSNETAARIAADNALRAPINQDRSLVIQNFANNLALDATATSGWDVTMTADINTVAVANTYTGQKLLFITAQDGTGNHALLWGAQFKNFGDPDPAPNSVTVYTGIVRADGNIYATSQPIG